MGLFENPHIRYNPLTGEKILVSPHRTLRPWQGKIEESSSFPTVEYDPECYLCPGNKRANGKTNPVYGQTYVFTNDYSALLPEIENASSEEDELFTALSEKGICRVMCFSPRHDLTLALMKASEIQEVIKAWILEYDALAENDFIGYVQIFENRGAMMGCSNPHPHCQIWGSQTVPAIPAKEDRRQKEYFRKYRRCLLCDYAKKESIKNERLVFENDSFLVLVPFWAVWPFETMIIPKEHLNSITAMNDRQIMDLAFSVNHLCVKYDNLFLTNFPYSMGIHQKPTDHASNDHWHFHLHFYPPLLRSATIQKFMVGYELMANPQRDLSAEKSAAALRNSSGIHFLKGPRE